jgi:beta-galactosidase
MPQEHGHHTDVRWLELSDLVPARRPATLRVAASGALEFNASHFTAEDLYAARHTTDLKARPETILYLDAAQRGLGTASCGPDALARYRLPAGSHAFGYVLSIA